MGNARAARLLESQVGKEPDAIGVDSASGGAELDTSAWPRTDDGRIALLISDGVYTKESVLGPFSVPEKPPRIIAVGPFRRLHNVRVPRARRELPIELSAFAFDPETGPIADEAIFWTSARDGEFGTGATIRASQLSPG